MTIYQELAARVKAPQSKTIPRLFQMLVDETEAKILLALPADVHALVDRLGLSSEEVETRIHELYLKGVVFPSRKTSPPTYHMPAEVVHFHDTSVQWKGATREFLDLWQEWVEKEFPAIAKHMEKMTKGKKPPGRIIAANIWIEPKTHVLHFDSLREMVKKAKSLAVLPCSCRMKVKKCDAPVEACVVLNKSADYNIERGTGRKIDEQEALDIFKKAEEAGLVHIAGGANSYDPGPIICNCCPCCCMGMPLLMKGMVLNDPSRFCAKISSELCSGCGVCHDRCYFGALTWANEEGGVSVVKAEKCMGCGLCQVVCPEGAIDMIEARPEDFVPETGSSIY